MKKWICVSFICYIVEVQTAFTILDLCNPESTQAVKFLVSNLYGGQFSGLLQINIQLQSKSNLHNFIIVGWL